MKSKILKSTERGQITLPKQWRDNFPSDHYFVEMKEDKLIITPFETLDDPNEEVLFDADRDNNGKDVSPAEIITILKNIKKHG